MVISQISQAHYTIVDSVQITKSVQGRSQIGRGCFRPYCDIKLRKGRAHYHVSTCVRASAVSRADSSLVSAISLVPRTFFAGV